MLLVVANAGGGGVWAGTQLALPFTPLTTTVIFDVSTETFTGVG
jgi:hypothetical protein